MSVFGADPEFNRLLALCKELGDAFSSGLIFIGGVAAYLYAINVDKTKSLAETTHDADFYISIADMADLRDLEEVTPNRRLSKHQLIKGGFEFDIYTERHSGLIVPYDQVAAAANTFDTLRVAGLEHLLVLKLEAFSQRRASAKGEKDAKDLIRIALVASEIGFKKALSVPYLTDDSLALLNHIERGPHFLALARGNAKDAKNFRETYKKFLREL